MRITGDSDEAEQGSMKNGSNCSEGMGYVDN